MSSRFFDAANNNDEKWPPALLRLQFPILDLTHHLTNVQCLHFRPLVITDRKKRRNILNEKYLMIAGQNFDDLIQFYILRVPSSAEIFARVSVAIL